MVRWPQHQLLLLTLLLRTLDRAARRCLGEENPITMSIMFNYGSLLQLTGKLDEATPLVYEFDDAQEPIPQKDAIAPLQGRYLGDQEAIRARIEGVKAQTK